MQNFVLSYNSSYHRTIKMRPIDVSEDNQNIVFKNIYGYNSMTDLLKNINISKKDLLKEGDMVRKKIDLKSFDKSYYPLWSDVVYKVQGRKEGNLHSQYFLSEPVSNSKLKQKPYKSQIQKIIPEKYRVEKILKRKQINGQLYYFVKFVGYKNNANTWILANNL